MAPPQKNSDKYADKCRPRPAEFELESARREVFNLGVSGFTHKDKQEAKRELAIKLGATPKKPAGKDMKRHMEEVKEKKEQAEKKREERQAYGQDR